MDETGNVYVTGLSQQDDGTRCVTIKYDPDGTQKWMKQFTDEGNGGYDISVDARGDVLVTGSGWPIGGTSPDCLTVKYTQTPRHKIPLDTF